MMTVTITKTGDDDETMCDSHTYENKNELIDMLMAMTTTTIKMQQCTAVRRTEASQMAVNGCHKLQAPV